VWTRYSDGVTRDALLSRLCGQCWPFDPLLDALTLNTDWAVLDIGAGNGELLARLRTRKHSGPLTGLDPQPGPGVQAGRAERLPFVDDSFGIVFLVRTLLHVTDPDRALAEARRVLRPGGLLIVAVQGTHHLAAFWTLYGPARESADAATARLLTGQDFGRLDLRLPIRLSPQDASALARSYNLPTLPMSDDLQTEWHLAVFVLHQAAD
jgi:SAM-dependent methyltransferase